MTLGGGQHLEAPHGRSGRLLQRLHQLSSARCIKPQTGPPQSTPRTCTVSAKPVAQIVHRQRQRIVGALLAAKSTSIPPRPAACLACRHPAAMAVVQQRREQRQRRRHAAAALRQRQRGMLVAQQLRQQAHAFGARSPPRPASPTAMRTGSVLMNIPSARSAPAPPCMRPNSTVPNTTSSRPDVRASTCAQARWKRLAALTPSARACARRRRASSASQRDPRLLDVATIALHVERGRRAASARRRRPAWLGRTPRAPPHSRQAAPAPQNCGTAPAAPVRTSGPGDGPASRRSARPAWCGPSPDDGTAAAAASAHLPRSAAMNARISGAWRTSSR